MADKTKVYGVHYVKLCKYCSTVADAINNALLRVIAWRQNKTDWPTDLAICSRATSIFPKPIKHRAISGIADFHGFELN